MPKIIACLLALMLLSACGTAPVEDATETNSEPTTESVAISSEETTVVEEKAEPDTDWIGAGTYLVGKDIEPGLYKVEVTDTIMNMGYVERAKGVSMDFDDILANIVLTGDGYVEIKDTDMAVKFQGVRAKPINLAEIEPNIKEVLEDGIHLVGYDIIPGIYQVEVTDTTMGMGYVERTRNVAMDFSDIIANEVFQGPGYVEVKESDFAIRVQGAVLRLQ